MDKKFIEMVCKGNLGRSPVAELIAKNYLNKIGIFDKYGARSSGTLVQDFEKDKIPLPIKLKLLNQGLQTNIYDSLDKNMIKTAMKKEDLGVIELYFQRTVEIFSANEHSYRTQTLKKFDIEGLVKDERDQTKARLDNLAVFSMDTFNSEKVRKIYDNNSFLPNIELLGFAATGKKIEVPNAYGKSLEDYEKTIEALTFYVPKAIDNLLHEG